MSAEALMVLKRHPLVSDADPLTAFGTTSGEHGTAALGGHTRTEAVALGALPLVGLISAFHLLPPRKSLDRGLLSF